MKRRYRTRESTIVLSAVPDTLDRSASRHHRIQSTERVLSGICCASLLARTQTGQVYRRRQVVWSRHGSIGRVDIRSTQRRYSNRLRTEPTSTMKWWFVKAFLFTLSVSIICVLSWELVQLLISLSVTLWDYLNSIDWLTLTPDGFKYKKG